MKKIYITPDVLVLHVDTEGLICISIGGVVSGTIDSVDEGKDYGDL